MKPALAFLFILLMTSLCWGQANLSMHRPMSYRQMGMGGAFTALADDYFLIFHNPAGLLANEKKFSKTQERKGLFNLFSLGVGAPISTLSIFDDLINGSLTTSFDSSIDEQERINNAIDFFGQFNRASLGGYLNPIINIGYTGYRFGINLFLDGYIEITPFLDSTQSDLEVKGDINLHLMTGFSLFKFNILGTTLYLGGAFRLSSLISIDGTIGINLIESSLQEILDEYATSGVAIGLDWGAIWDLNHGVKVGLTLHDLPTFFFEYDISDRRFRTDRYHVIPNIDIGVAYSFPIFKGLFPNWFLSEMHAAFDLQRIFDPNVSLGKSMKLGVTANLLDFNLFLLNLSLGFNGGFNNFNASTTMVFFKFLRLHVGYFSENKGKFAYAYQEQKVLMDLSIRW